MTLTERRHHAHATPPAASGVGADPGRRTAGSAPGDTGTRAESRRVGGSVRREAVGLGVPAPIAARWDRAGGVQVRTLHVLRAGTRLRGVAFTVHRPSAAYDKVAGWWLADTDAAGELFAVVVAHARAGGAVVVKVEVDERSVADAHALVEAALAAGFEPTAGPDDADDAPRGLSRWYGDEPAPRVSPYRRQAADVTSGAAALATALATSGVTAAPTAGHAVATAGDDVLGLAVVAAERGARPRMLVAADSPHPRDGLRDRAVALGLTVEARPFDISEVVVHVAEGGAAMVLLDQHPLRAEPDPHWVTLHAVRGTYAVVHDPWADERLGESWLDAADLPVSLGALDEIAAWGDPFYRAALLF